MTAETGPAEITEYGAADHAAAHPSSAATQAPIDPALRNRLVAALDVEGYVIVPDVFDPETVEHIRGAVEPLFEHDGGRNDFEGRATRRLYSPLDRTWALDPVVEHPIVLGVLDELFEPNYLLSQLQVIDIAPGESAQPLHPDDAFYPVPRPRPAIGAATIVAIDEFTESNGATMVIPRSHLWDDQLPTAADVERAVPALMSPGSVLMFVGTLWHGGGANRSPSSRMCATAQYCRPWARPQENFSLSVSRDRARGSSEHLQRLLGYSIHPPFMGMVNGMHPKRTLARP